MRKRFGYGTLYAVRMHKRPGAAAFPPPCVPIRIRSHFGSRLKAAASSVMGTMIDDNVIALLACLHRASLPRLAARLGKHCQGCCSVSQTLHAACTRASATSAF